MTLEVDIRSLEATDQSAWLPLWQGYQDFYRVSIPEGATSTTWSRLLDPAEPVHGALAWNGDKALGMVHFIQHRSCWTTSDYCYLQDVFVGETRRGSGIGRKLIEHVYAEAARLGCARVYWLTHETNQTAMQLYDRVATRSGFIQYRQDLPTEAPDAGEKRA